MFSRSFGASPGNPVLPRPDQRKSIRKSSLQIFFAQRLYKLLGSTPARTWNQRRSSKDGPRRAAPILWVGSEYSISVRLELGGMPMHPAEPGKNEGGDGAAAMPAEALLRAV